jgi:hypothetical protein
MGNSKGRWRAAFGCCWSEGKLDGLALEGGLLAGKGGLGTEGLCRGAGSGLSAGVDVSGLGAECLKLLLLGAKAGGAGGRLRGQIAHPVIFSWVMVIG